MRKIQIFRWNDAKKVEDEVNEFIKDKNVISIQHQMCPVYDKFTGSGVPTSLIVYDSVMVEYEESSVEDLKRDVAKMKLQSDLDNFMSDLLSKTYPPLDDAFDKNTEEDSKNAKPPENAPDSCLYCPYGPKCDAEKYFLKK